MSYNETDWVKAITKLIELTSKQEISWDIFSEYEEDPWTTVHRAYASPLNGKYYVIKSSRYRHYTDEDEWFWASKFEFEVYNKENYSDYVKIATAPDLSVISTLFSVVESNFAFRQNALKGLLD
ncbi:hypothetical protein QD357_11620 [Rhizobium sp. BR 317]|uniref:hypothetical protein n=1 Tax=Rhizobium sp. BR 317 TaxID=3040015 RepID=UPI0039BEF955